MADRLTTPLVQRYDIVRFVHVCVLSVWDTAVLSIKLQMSRRLSEAAKAAIAGAVAAAAPDGRLSLRGRGALNAKNGDVSTVQLRRVKGSQLHIRMTSMSSPTAAVTERMGEPLM